MEFDLHVHSRYSFDSTLKPRRIIQVARKVGLHGVAIVDHNCVEGGLEGMQLASGTDFIVIPGFEVGTTAGDIIALFVNEVPDTKDPFELVSWIKQHDGFAILAHPFTQALFVEIKLVQQLHAVETFNARHPTPLYPEFGFGKESLESFAREYNLTMVAGSDAHFYREIGRGRTVIPASNLEEIKHALLNGNTLAIGQKTSPIYILLSKLLGYLKGLTMEGQSLP